MLKRVAEFMQSEERDWGDWAGRMQMSFCFLVQLFRSLKSQTKLDGVFDVNVLRVKCV